MRLIFLAYLSVMLHPVYAEEAVTKSNILKPEDLGIKKWDVAYQTTKDKTFVIRLQHYVNGKLVKDYEDFYYDPKRSDLGALLVFHRPALVVYFPKGGSFEFEVCKNGVTHETTTNLACVDGVTREARTIYIIASDLSNNTERLFIHLYAAPMKIFTDNDSEVPTPTDDNSFSWRREIIPQVIVSTETINSKLEVKFWDTSKDKATKK